MKIIVCKTFICFFMSLLTAKFVKKRPKKLKFISIPNFDPSEEIRKSVSK